MSEMDKQVQATINELLAGSVGGAAQVLVGQPLDTIKTRAQVAPSTFYLYLMFGASEVALVCEALV